MSLSTTIACFALAAACGASLILYLRQHAAAGVPLEERAGLLVDALRKVAQQERKKRADQATAKAAQLALVTEALTKLRVADGRRSLLFDRSNALLIVAVISFAAGGAAILAGGETDRLAAATQPPSVAPVTAEVLDDSDADLARLKSYADKLPARTPTEAPQSKMPSERPANLPAVDVMIARLVERLAANGNDVEGWRMLGWSYAHLGEHAKAASAYERAVALDKGRADLRLALGEAIVHADGGKVSERARGVFDEVLALDPGNTRALYFKALARADRGEKAAAHDADPANW